MDHDKSYQLRNSIKQKMSKRSTDSRGPLNVNTANAGSETYSKSNRYQNVLKHQQASTPRANYASPEEQKSQQLIPGHDALFKSGGKAGKKERGRVLIKSQHESIMPTHSLHTSLFESLKTEPSMIRTYRHLKVRDLNMPYAKEEEITLLDQIPLFYLNNEMQPHIIYRTLSMLLLWVVTVLICFLVLYFKTGWLDVIKAGQSGASAWRMENSTDCFEQFDYYRIEESVIQ